MTNTLQHDVSFNRSFANTQMRMYNQDTNSMDTLDAARHQSQNNYMNTSHDWTSNSVEQQRHMKSLLINQPKRTSPNQNNKMMYIDESGSQERNNRNQQMNSNSLYAVTTAAGHDRSNQSISAFNKYRTSVGVSESGSNRSVHARNNGQNNLGPFTKNFQNKTTRRGKAGFFNGKYQQQQSQA